MNPCVCNVDLYCSLGTVGTGVVKGAEMRGGGGRGGGWGGGWGGGGGLSERQKDEVTFNSLVPVNGKVSGEKGKMAVVTRRQKIGGRRGRGGEDGDIGSVLQGRYLK